MEGLSALFQTFSEMFTPFISFIIWAFPLKISHLSDGERGVVLTLGRVRRKNAEKGPGLVFYFSFEELTYCQALGCSIDFPEQVITTVDEKMSVINGAVIYRVDNVKKAVIETESLEDLIAGYCQNEIREYSRTRRFEDIASASRLTSGLATRINKKVAKHGVSIEQVMITDLRPHEFMLICDTARELFKK